MKMTKNAPTYTLASSSGKNRDTKKSSNHRRRSHSEDACADPTDGNASLTYSAASSVNSGGSATGESTDSSFADIMRVLDMEDSDELREILKKEGVSSAGELRQKRMSAGLSVASSLAYSADGETHLAGTSLLQTIAGQPSDSYGFDGGSRKEEAIKGDNNILFAPADSGLVKKKKRNKDKGATNTTPKSKNSKRYDGSPATSIDTPTKSPPSSELKPGTPPQHPRKSYVEDSMDDDEDTWYAKWWMSCFSDFNNLMPKR